MPSFRKWLLSHVTARDQCVACRNYTALYFDCCTYSYSYMSYHVIWSYTSLDIAWYKGYFHWLTDSTKALQWREPTCHLKSSETHWIEWINRKGFIHANWGMKHDEREIKSNQSQQTDETNGCEKISMLLSGWSTPPRLGNISESVNARLANVEREWEGNVWTAATLLTAKSRARHTNICIITICNCT